ncbi:MAG: hypothetical protein ACOCZC_02295 [Halodesulfurarchaeum sp.]
MPPPENPSDERTHYRGQTRSRPDLVAPDTEIVVTDAVVAARPLEEGEGQLDFEVPLGDLTELRCEGLLCRSMTLQTDHEAFEIPTDELDEGALRAAIIEHASLENTCTRLSIGNAGTCLCGKATCVGCLLTVVGIGLVLSVVGALLGVAVGGLGILMLIGVCGARKLSTWRGSNVWERSGEPKSPA